MSFSVCSNEQPTTNFMTACHSHSKLP